MTAGHEIIGEEWQARSPELADWAMGHLVNRLDVWGQYALLAPHQALEEGRSYRAMTLPVPEMRGKDMVTLDKLTRHFASRRNHRPQLIGLHAESKQGTSRWLAIDIDNHDLDANDADDRARRNLRGAIEWWQALSEMGYDPLLFDSSGKGGYHLWVVLAEPAPTDDVHAMVKAMASTWERHHLEQEPEVFPKAPKPGGLNAWFRLPGMHHTQPHYSRLWSGDEWLSDGWLEGNGAIDAMLNVIPGPPPPPAGALTRDVKRAPGLKSAPAPGPSAQGLSAQGVSGQGLSAQGVSKPGPTIPGEPGHSHSEVLESQSSSPELSPPEFSSPERSPSGSPATGRHPSRDGRPRVCLTLEGVLIERASGRGKAESDKAVPGKPELDKPALDATELGEPIAGAVQFSHALAETADVIIHSPRWPSDGPALDAPQAASERLRHWLDRHGFAYHEIVVVAGKPRASAYVDDRTVSCRPQQQGPGAYHQALEELRSLCG